jgi:hypothetical protein
MKHDGKPFNRYDTGTDFWRDNVAKYGIDEAVVICHRYLDMNLKREHTDRERQFCREVFVAMYEGTADKVVPTKLVYPYDFKTAHDRAETSYFHKNRNMNQACVRAIDTAISASNYEVNYFNLELSAMAVINEHGFVRVNAVLAHQIQKHESDGRYSGTNKRWAQNIVIQDNTHVFLCSHATLVDAFTTYVRKLYASADAEQYTLPGREEYSAFEYVHGYQILWSIMFSENQGYVIAFNPDAVDPFVCWQFTQENNQRDYYWGIYGSEQAAIDAYNARLFVKYN